ncbi:hypothetical protein CHGG_01826 [Chaetomium globosum CBS 148.51]|uniref:FCP1 homology domain-containing protein n=1 Tax=Chaetomium globosum (strain ATCC 6205 / CBS 148.51 / DSM 1962 / NBRC 6347 / NRRL 1970) TaxID=306901 RepID=Q2HD78_CHAGB|nr:uncharacterized protein CHGG_01826 [Chaetomium globosum CBS 148.51]EAQ93591.1 hypothetical protein CHGG_01826 [Chaetomium globosum CBS 148.51]
MEGRLKKGGLLALFGCCGVPDSANGIDTEAPVPSHKLDKIPARPATASRRTATPSEQPSGSRTHLSEKDVSQQAPLSIGSTRNGKRLSGVSTQDQSTVGGERDNESKQTTIVGPGASNLVISVEPPHTAGPDTDKVEEVPGERDAEGDVQMPDAEGSRQLGDQGSADFTIPVEIEGNYHNVYVIKRPGVDQFMKRVGELYEVVVFTASVSKYGDPLLDQLDIHKVVHHRLFRESCYNHQGNYVKDLSQVGRDLKDTIIIDNSPTSYIFHPQHAVPISSWFSDAHDNELLDLIPVLEDLAGPTVRDVSLVLDVTL